MVINKSTWSKIHGVSRAAVTLAVKSGALVENSDGFLDDQHPTNLAWVERRKNQGGAKTQKPAKPERPKRPEGRKAQLSKVVSRPDPEIEDEPDIDEIEDGDEDGYQDLGALSIAKVRAEIRFKHEQADAARQKRMERLGQLVERELVARAFSKLSQEIKTQFIDLPPRIAPHLVAMVKSGRPEIEVQRYLEQEVSRAIQDVKINGEDF